MKVHNSVTSLRSDGAAARAIDHTVCKGEFHNHVVWRISFSVEDLIASYPSCTRCGLAFPASAGLGHKSFLRPGAVAIISVPLALRRAYAVELEPSSLSW
jgi:hypothetical protein